MKFLASELEFLTKTKTDDDDGTIKKGDKKKILLNYMDYIHERRNLKVGYGQICRELPIEVSPPTVRNNYREWLKEKGVEGYETA